MQSNTDNFVNRQIEMQEMKKLYQFQLDQYKLSMSFMGMNQ